MAATSPGAAKTIAAAEDARHALPEIEASGEADCLPDPIKIVSGIRALISVAPTKAGVRGSGGGTGTRR